MFAKYRPNLTAELVLHIYIYIYIVGDVDETWPMWANFGQDVASFGTYVCICWTTPKLVGIVGGAFRDTWQAFVSRAFSEVQRICHNRPLNGWEHLDVCVVTARVSKS